MNNLKIRIMDKWKAIFFDSFNIIFHDEYLWKIAVSINYNWAPVVLMAITAFSLAHFCSLILGYILSRFSQYCGFKVENLSLAFFIKNHYRLVLISIAFIWYFGVILSFFYGYSLGILRLKINYKDIIFIALGKLIYILIYIMIVRNYS